MITVEEAGRVVTSRYPEATLVDCFEYDNTFYVFQIREGNKDSFDSPFFAVSKKTGRLTSMTPMSDLSGFFKARKEHHIDL